MEALSYQTTNIKTRIKGHVLFRYFLGEKVRTTN